MQKTILCIDDNETNLLYTKTLIEDLAGDKYTVETATSANEGFLILEKKRIALVLLDIVMPDIDGLEVAKMLRENRGTKELPIIFVTSQYDDETIEQCYKLGGDDYVKKPFNNAELISRISFHIDLKEKDRLLKREKEYAQNVLDLQDNLIFVSHGNYVVSVNKSLLNFFEVKDIFGLNKTYKCLLDAFLKEDEYFHRGKVGENKNWLEEIVELSKQEDVLVKILRNDRYYIFNIRVKPIDDQFIVSMTDITLMSQQTLEYKHDANYDALTNIYNRNMFHRLLDIQIITSSTNKKKFSFVMLDIDHFKNVNDTYGHLVGDNILVSLASLITNTIRDKDVFARWGGEEFVLIFNLDLDVCMQIVDNIRKKIEAHEFETVKNITCSFGVTEFHLDDTIDTLVKRADDTLYEAKETGRNKVCKQV